jgi:transcriptional regulator with XRE-family HTH domain
MTFGERLKELRKKRGLTQKRVSPTYQRKK